MTDKLPTTVVTMKELGDELARFREEMATMDTRNKASGDIKIDNTPRLKKDPKSRTAKMLAEHRVSLTKTYGDYIALIPNSRFQWFDSLMANVGEHGSFSQPDIDYVGTWYMNSEARRALMTMMEKRADKNKSGLTVPYGSSYPKGNWKPYVRSGGKSLVLVQNPGILNLELPKSILNKLATMPESDYIQLNNSIHDLVLKYDGSEHSSEHTAEDIVDKMSQTLSHMDTEEHDLLRMLDPNLIKALSKVKERFMLNSVSFKDLYAFVDVLRHYTHMEEDSYMASLIDPFSVVDAKIPTPVPIPTSSFKLRTSYSIGVNSSGNAAFIYDPFYLNMLGQSSFGVNNDVSLTGTAASNFFLAKDIGQSMPAAIYGSYRLVSAAIRCTCIASSINASGFITLGTDFSDAIYTAAISAPIPTAAAYGQFNLIENLYHHVGKAAVQGAEVMLRFIPKDESYFDYVPINNIRPTTFVGYITGVAASTNALRVDIVANYEAMVLPQYTDYIPMSYYDGDGSSLPAIQKQITPGMTVAQNLKGGDSAKLNAIFSPEGKHMSAYIDKAINMDTPLPIPVSSSTSKNFFETLMEYAKPIASVIGTLGALF